MRWLLLVALTGCLVVPKTTETITPLERTSLPMRIGPVGPLALAARVSHGGIEAIATRTRQCTSEVRQRFAERRSTEADIATPDGADPRTFAAMVVLAVPAFLISAAVTSIEVAASSPEHHDYVKTVSVTVTDCSLEAPAVALDVVMPSGAVVHGVTDEHGRFSVRVPNAEPARGIVLVRAGDQMAEVEYRRAVRVPSPQLAFQVQF